MTLVQDQTFDGVSIEVSYHRAQLLYTFKAFILKLVATAGEIRWLEIGMGDGSPAIFAAADQIHHIYTQPGIYNVCIKASNRVNEIVTLTSLEVIEPEGEVFFIGVNASGAKVGENTTVTHIMHGGSNVIIETQPDNGILVIEDMDDVEIPGLDITSEDIVYDESGTFNYSRTAYYNGGYIQTWVIIGIIDNTSLIITANDEMDFECMKEMKIPFNAIENDLQCLLFFGDNVIANTTYTQNFTTGVSDLTVPVSSVHCSGDQRAKLVCYNKHKVANTFINLEIVIPLCRLTFNSTKYIYYIDQTIDMFFSVDQGTGLNVSVKFSNISGIQLDLCDIPKPAGVLFNVSTSYHLPQEYNVHLTVSNALSSLKSSITIVVVRPLPDMICTVDKTLVPAAYEVSFTLQLINTAALVPIRFYLMMDWGDNTDLQVQLNDTTFILSTSYEYTQKHAYTANGTFNATCRVYHDLDYIFNSTIIDVLIINELNITTDTCIIPLGEYANFRMNGITAANAAVIVDFGDTTMTSADEQFIIDPAYEMSFDHMYTAPGDFNVTVSVVTGAFNASATVSCIIIVQGRINGLRLDITETVLPFPGSLLSFSICQLGPTLYDANHVTCVFHYGDGDSSTTTETEMLIPADCSAPLAYNYTYQGPVTPSPAMYNISITCWNMINTETNFTYITVENLAFIHIPRMIFNDYTALGTFRYSVSNNLALSLTHVKIQVDISFGDGSVNVSRYLTSLESTYDYSARGNYSFSERFSYNINKGDLQELIYSAVLQVGLIHIDASTNITTSKVNQTFNAWGWNELPFFPYKYTIDYGDTTQTEECRDTDSCSSGDHMITFVHVFPYDGIFTVKILAFHTSIGAESLTTNILVQHSVVPVFLVTLTPQLIIPGIYPSDPNYRSSPDAEFDLILPNEEISYTPTDADCTLRFGDQQRSFITFPLDFMGDTKITKSFSYNNVITNQSLFYANVTLQCTNLASEMVEWVEVQLVERIMNVTLWCELWELPMGKVEMGYPLGLILSASTGANLTFFLDFGDLSNDTEIGNDTQLSFETNHAFRGLDTYNTTGKINNHMEEVALPESYNCSIPTYQVVNVSLDMFNYSVACWHEYDYVNGYTLVTFDIIVGEAFMPPVNLSIRLDFGDTDRYFGHLESMKVTHEYKITQVFWTTLTGIIHHSNIQDTSDDENITLPSVPITVFKPCLAPILIFPTEYSTEDTTLNIKVSQPLLITSDVILRCAEYSVHNFEWTITSKTDGTLLPVVVKGYVNKLSYPERQLPPGLYHLHLNVSVVSPPTSYNVNCTANDYGVHSDTDPPEVTTVLSASAEMFFRIKRTPFVCNGKKSMCGGVKQQGFSQQLSISGKDSLQCEDPDVTNQVLTHYEWACKQLSGKELNLAAIHIQMPAQYSQCIQ